jgi:hypothetical protein
MLNLGLIYEDGKPVAHRTLLKILLNPILRKCFGIAIVSVIENDKFIKYRIIKQSTVFS